MSNVPKMTRRQAKIFWNSLSREEKVKFNDLMKRLENKELELTYVGVDDNEQIQRIVLENKDRPRIPTEPFAKHFHLKD